MRGSEFKKIDCTCAAFLIINIDLFIFDKIKFTNLKL